MSEFTYTTIAVSGPDAFEFLQAQLATDLATVVERDNETLATPHRSAWCNPKGRVICTPTVAKVGGDYTLTIPADLGEAVAQRLTIFRFRSKVEFDLTSDKSLDSDARLRLLQAGIAEIARAQSEKYTPHMLNLDILQMVSVEKGCYPGQEIVARTHFRGASKRRCFRFSCEIPVQAGDKVSDGEREVGEVVNALQGELLAVIPVSTAGSTLLINTTVLQKLELPYAV